MKLAYLIRGLPGHPLHPPLTDVTIGVYTFATVAAILAKLGLASDEFATAWWLALVIGLISSVFTVASGIAEWLTITWGASSGRRRRRTRSRWSQRPCSSGSLRSSVTTATSATR